MSLSNPVTPEDLVWVAGVKGLILHSLKQSPGHNHKCDISAGQHLFNFAQLLGRARIMKCIGWLNKEFVVSPYNLEPLFKWNKDIVHTLHSK